MTPFQYLHYATDRSGTPEPVPSILGRVSQMFSLLSGSQKQEPASPDTLIPEPDDSADSPPFPGQLAESRIEERPYGWDDERGCAIYYPFVEYTILPQRNATGTEPIKSITLWIPCLPSHYPGHPAPLQLPSEWINKNNSVAHERHLREKLWPDILLQGPLLTDYMLHYVWPHLDGHHHHRVQGRKEAGGIHPAPTEADWPEGCYPPLLQSHVMLDRYIAEGLTSWSTAVTGAKDDYELDLASVTSTRPCTSQAYSVTGAGILFSLAPPLLSETQSRNAISSRASFRSLRGVSLGRRS